MKVICLGDSLTEGDYGIKGKRGIANIHSENYPYFLSENTGWDVTNYGKCGFRTNDYLTYYENGNVDAKNADVIVIMLGTNGGHDPKENTECNDAYIKLINLLRADAPQAKIVLCTPPQATVNEEYSNCGYMPQINKAVEFIRAVAKRENLPLIDVFKCEYFTPETEAIMQPNDGLHFSKEGYQKLASVIENEIRKIV